MDIEELPGLGDKIAEKLREAGFTDLMSIATASPQDLADAADVNDATAKRIIVSARNEMKMGFMTGTDMLEKSKQVGRITTASKEFDKLLGGGVETQAITEAFGQFGSGKTQLGLQLAINVQLPVKEGGLDGHAVWVDSENTFRPQRVITMAKAAGLKEEDALQKIHVARAFSSDHQILLAENIPELINEKEIPIRLIVVDSLMSLFRSEYVGRGTLANRQQKLNKHMHYLQKLADRYNLAVYVTNQVMSSPDVFFGDPTRPVGGNVVGHTCLTGDSLVQMADGLIQPISEVIKNSDILSLDINNSLKLSKDTCLFTSSRQDIKVVYEIDTGYKVSASSEHVFFKIEGLKVIEIKAKDIKKGDYLMHAGSINTNTSIQSIPEITNERFVKLTKFGSEFIKSELERLGINRSEFCNSLSIIPRQFRRVLNECYPVNINDVNSISEMININSGDDHFMPYSSYKHRPLESPNELGIELAQILGYFLGDGGLDKRSVEFKDERESVLNKYKNYFKDIFNIDSNISKISNKNCYRLRVNSLLITNLFRKLKNDVFRLVSLSPNDQVRAFIKGFADAEGHVDKKRPRITISQNNEQLLKFIQLLLLRFNIRSRIQSYAKLTYHLMIESRDVLKFGEVIGLTAPDKSRILNKWIKHCKKTFNKEIVPVERRKVQELLRKVGLSPSKYVKSRSVGKYYNYINTEELNNIVKAISGINIPISSRIKNDINFLCSLRNSDIRWEKVRKIEKKKNKEPLYDLSVSNHKNYIANAFIVHNSTFRLYLRKSKGDKRIARLIDSPCLPEGECVFRVTENGVQD